MNFGIGMKTPVLVFLAAFAATLGSPSAWAQYRSPRQYMRRIAPPPQPAPAQPSAVAQPPPSAVALPPGPAVMAPPPASAPTEADLAKAAAEKEAADKRVLEFQRKRAEVGSPTAQYELGIRYLTGKGVEKNLAEARKWLEAAAKQDNVWAKRKLKELDEHPETAAKAVEGKTTAKAADPVTGEAPPAAPPPASPRPDSTAPPQ